MFVPIFIQKIITRFQKRNSPNEYLKVTSGFEISDEFKALVKTNKDLLLLNQVPINKIRFTALPSFIYDIDKDEVNPRHEIFLPLRKDGSGLFDNSAPVIQHTKTCNTIMVNVRSYKVDDNYAFIKNMLKNSKRGVVIFLVDEIVKDIKGNDMIYRSEVDSQILRIIDLDEAVASIPEIVDVIV